MLDWRIILAYCSRDYVSNTDNVAHPRAWMKSIQLRMHMQLRTQGIQLSIISRLYTENTDRRPTLYGSPGCGGFLGVPVIDVSDPVPN